MPYLQLGATNFATVSGVCKPSDLATLASFKNLQAQLNRIATGYNKILGHNVPLVSVDGDIGPGTMQLFEQVQAWLTADTQMAIFPMAQTIMGQSTDSCSSVAGNADVLAASAQGCGDTLGVPSQISQPASGSSTLVSSMGTQTTVHTPTPANNGIATSLTDLVGGLDTTTLLLLAAGAGAIIYYSGGKAKRGKSKRRSSRRRSHITIYR